jgi:hypothetical protein
MAIRGRQRRISRVSLQARTGKFDAFSRNRERTSEGRGKLVARINKADARVIWFMFDYVLIPPAESPKEN